MFLLFSVQFAPFANYLINQVHSHTETALDTSKMKGTRSSLSGTRQALSKNIVASMSGHKEGSKAFARYREIDKDIKRDALKVFEAI